MAISPTSIFPLFPMEDFFLQQRQPRLLTTPADPFPSLMDAVKEFACVSLVPIPANWIVDVLRTREQPVAMPICSWLFLVQGPWQVLAIRKRLSDHDFGEDLDRQNLMDAGWKVVPETGLFAIELDRQLLIGIDGIGYDFVEAHWRPLYEVLGLRWHLDD
ncbi:hypothetical protein [Rhodopirellula sallentina]|uniref:hypothetical protein n=1 Tax=Rhodopirellula sallentina TaxID=1263869 RepID=UPI001F3C66AF|nr:hypothetical protein [Rhodopirellula sallentina]